MSEPERKRVRETREREKKNRIYKFSSKQQAVNFCLNGFFMFWFGRKEMHKTIGTLLVKCKRGQSKTHIFTRIHTTHTHTVIKFVVHMSMLFEHIIVVLFCLDTKISHN